MHLGIGFLVILVIVYVGSYALNKRIPSPVDDRISAAKCGACSNYGCAIKQDTAEEK